MTNSGLHITILIILLIIASFLLYRTLRFKKGSTRKTSRDTDADNGQPKGRPCPLCGERLMPGQKVHSVLYPGKPDKLMEIYGCPYCETPSSPNKRRCPVCGKQMKDDSVLIARVFEKPGKTHVHVLGCSECYSGRSRIMKKNT